MEDTLFAIAFSLSPGIGPQKYREAVKKFPSAKEAIENIEEINRQKVLPALIEKAKKDAEEIVKKCEKNNITIITQWDDTYPELLKNIHSPPAVFYMRGDREVLKETCVSIVGTRRTTRYGREITRQIAAEIASEGITIVSGLAIGIDTFAHRGALDGGGKTIAVLPSAIDKIYPPSNRQLGEKIAEDGAVISEYPPGEEYHKSHFYLRNRIISGLCRWLIVVEAPEKSGALVTAKFALEQNRDIFAVPGNINSTRSTGTNRLIKEGAIPFLSTEDFFNETNLQKKSQIIQLPELNEEEKRIYSLLERDMKHFDELIIEAKIDFGRLVQLLMSMEEKGYIEEIPGNYYRRK